MRGISSIVAIAAMAACAVAFGPSATAQEDVTPKFKIAPDVLQLQQEFQVQIEEGTCPGGLESATSPGFAAAVGAGSLTGTAGEQPGKFAATLKCKGSAKTGTAEFEIIDKRAYPRFKIVPSTLKPNQAFEIQFEKGDCADGGTVVSTGFRENIPEGSLHGFAGENPGKYAATAYCKGHAYKSSTEFEIVALTNDDTFYFAKSEYAPGEAITATYRVYAKCVGDLNSTGFVAPIKFQQKADLRYGTGRVVDTPGSYVASMTCDNITVKQPFTVKAQKPKAKAPVIKPKGAPETGGGGTA